MSIRSENKTFLSGKKLAVIKKDKKAHKETPTIYERKAICTILRGLCPRVMYIRTKKAIQLSNGTKR